MPYPQLLEKPYTGYNSPKRKRVRSRETFATTEAAAIEGQRPSPPTTATCSLPRCFAGNPSTNTTLSLSAKASKARAMAIWLATKILFFSISSKEASPTPHLPVFPFVRSSKSASLLMRVSFFESSNPGISISLWWNRYAAATTGPARAPRPASSTPTAAEFPASEFSVFQRGGIYFFFLVSTTSRTAMSERPRK